MPRSRVPEQAAHLINKIQLSYVRKIQYYSEQALINFYEAVNLSQKSVLQDMLRILKIMEDFNTDIENHNSSSPNDNGQFYQIFFKSFKKYLRVPNLPTKNGSSDKRRLFKVWLGTLAKGGAANDCNYGCQIFGSTTWVTIIP